MRSTIVVSVLILIIFSSCKKETVTEKDPMTAVMGLKDSCSYSIDGKVYKCTQSGSYGFLNLGVNLDTANKGWNWNPDSLMYCTQFAMEYSGDTEDGYLEIYFCKKFAKKQLGSSWTGILAAPSDTVMYTKGVHRYSTDFFRFNTEEGIALKVKGPGPTSLISYIGTSAVWPTTLGPNCQDNSSFEITNFYTFKDGTHLLEAKFTANVFDKDENSKRLENGYLRLHID